MLKKIICICLSALFVIGLVPVIWDTPAEAAPAMCSHNWKKVPNTDFTETGSYEYRVTATKLNFTQDKADDHDESRAKWVWKTSTRCTFNGASRGTQTATGYVGDNQSKTTKPGSGRVYMNCSGQIGKTTSGKNMNIGIAKFSVTVKRDLNEIYSGSGVTLNCFIQQCTKCNARRTWFKSADGNCEGQLGGVSGGDTEPDDATEPEIPGTNDRNDIDFNVSAAYVNDDPIRMLSVPAIPVGEFANVDVVFDNLGSDCFNPKGGESVTYTVCITGPDGMVVTEYAADHQDVLAEYDRVCDNCKATNGELPDVPEEIECRVSFTPQSAGTYTVVAEINPISDGSRKVKENSDAEDAYENNKERFEINVFQDPSVDFRVETLRTVSENEQIYVGDTVTLEYCIVNVGDLCYDGRNRMGQGGVPISITLLDPDDTLCHIDDFSFDKYLCCQRGVTKGVYDYDMHINSNGQEYCADENEHCRIEDGEFGSSTPSSIRSFDGTFTAAQAGTYTVTVAVNASSEDSSNYYGEKFERNFSNNTKSITIEVYDKPGIAVEKVNEVGQRLANVDFGIYSLSNGTYNLLNTITTDEYGLASFDGTDLADGTYYFKELSVPSGYNAANIKYESVDRDAFSYETIETDTGYIPFEIERTSGIANFRVTNHKLPDLTVKIETPESVPLDDSAIVTVKVINQSASMITDFTVSFSWIYKFITVDGYSVPEPENPDDVVTIQIPVDSIDPYDVIPIELTLNAEYAGITPIVATVDYHNEIEEFNEENNLDQSALHIKASGLQGAIVFNGTPDFYAGYEIVVPGYVINNDDTGYEFINAKVGLYETYYSGTNVCSDPVSGTVTEVLSAAPSKRICDDLGFVPLTDVFSDDIGINLIPVKIRLPEKTGTYYLQINVNEDRDIQEADYTDNIFVLPIEIEEYAPMKQVDSYIYKSDAYYQNKRPEPAETTARTVGWSMIEWKDGAWQRNDHSLTLTIESKLSPGDYLQMGDSPTLESGFGVILRQTVTVRGTGVYTDPQIAESRYPESGYGSPAYANYFEQTDLFADGAQTTAEKKVYVAMNKEFYPEDEGHWLPEGFRRIHYIPLWFPDGPYTVNGTVGYLWTPAGVLGVSQNASITVSGDMYDRITTVPW